MEVTEAGMHPMARSPVLRLSPQRCLPALLGAAVLPSGCTGGRAHVTPGDVLHVREEFTFFFHDQDDRYAFPPLAEVQNLFHTESWKVPSDLTLERPEV